MRQDLCAIGLLLSLAIIGVSWEAQAQTTLVAVNAGGAAFTTAEGLRYQADMGFRGGTKATTTNSIANTTDDRLYQSERYGNFSYAFAVPHGTHQVTLKFAEIFWTAANRRVFDVQAEGQTVISRLDIYAQVGARRAYDVTIPVTVTDGTLNLTFVSIKDYAKISAILVQGDGSEEPEEPGTAGGFVEPSSSTAVRPQLAASQIQAFLPNRGPFTFPAPYQTRGIRLTNGSDCGGTDCVNSVGYAYWRRINQHSGRETFLAMMVLDVGSGGTGPTLFEVDKTTDQVTKLGPLFAPSDPFYYDTGETWYFSARQPHALYIHDQTRLYRFDVLTKQLTTVLNIHSAAAAAVVGSNRIIWQIHSSHDDAVHSMTVRSSANADLGCLAYKESTKQFFWFPSKRFNYNECQIDRSGRWLMILEDVNNAGGSDAEDMRLIDLSGARPERVILDPYGAVGHFDSGHGYVVGSDNWHRLPGAYRSWPFDPALPPGVLQTHNADWLAEVPQHLSHTNARGDRPMAEQYACGSSANERNSARANEIICFRLDGSLRVLVVAPVMTNLNAAGGGDDYNKFPKGNLDVTGHYFIWTSNMAGPRLDAFIVKVPSQLLFP